MQNEAKILKFLKYAPLFFIVVISSLTISLISFDHYKNLKKEKEFFSKYYYESEKVRIDELIDAIYKYILNREENKVEDLKSQLKNYVNNAHSIMTSIYEENKNIKSKEEIISLMKDVLRNLKYYDGRGYYFIYDLKGKTVLNGQFPELEGKSLWNFKDSKGVYLLQEMSKILSKQDSTFYTWHWKNIDSNVESEKIGYFKKFEPYDIFIGMGEYTNDFNEKLKNEIMNYVKLLKSKNDEYVFLSDKDHNIIVNRNELLQGENAFNSKYIKIADSQKKKLIDIQTAKKPSTFVEYEIFNPETQEYDLKTSYFKWFDRWNWYLGTGFKNSDVDAIILKREKELEISYSQSINKILFTSLVIVVLLMTFSLMITKYLENTFQKYKKSIDKSKQKLLKAQEIANMGDWEYCLIDKRMYWSKQIYNILNIEPSKKPNKISKSFLSTLIHEEDLEKFNKAMEKTIKEGIGDDNIYKVYDSSMNIKYIDFKSEKVSDVKLVGILQDVTHRIESEIEKEKKEKMLFQQSKLAAMGEMIGNIAHQWRQPLSTISTVCTGIRIQKEHNILTDTQLIDGMDSINNSVQYLSNTIDDFRNFFEPKKDKLNRFNIAETFTKTLKLISAQFMNRNIRVHENILSIEVNSLENELVQVFINILNNAKDAFSNISTTQKHIFINVKEYNGKIKIEIYDNAGGIDKKFIDRIFEPYFTTKHKSQGTGIGLYMSQEIIKTLIKGDISVENYDFVYEDENYRGAKFTITFDKNGEKIN